MDQADVGAAERLHQRAGALDVDALVRAVQDVVRLGPVGGGGAVDREFDLLPLDRLAGEGGDVLAPADADDDVTALAQVGREARAQVALVAGEEGFS